MITLASPSLCLPRKDSLPPSPLALSLGRLVAPVQLLSSHTGQNMAKTKAHVSASVLLFTG